MDPDSEILLDCSPMFRQYKSGRVERLFGTETVPASVDHATGVTSKDVTIDADRNISVRLYLPKLIESPSAAKLPVLIYIHGGGFTNGSAFNPNPFLLSLVAKSSILAVSVDYRLAPENLLPAAYDDCWDTYMWVMSHASGTGPEVWLIEQADFNHVFLFGESAGANIAHNMGMRAGMEVVKFDGIILGHPYFWGTEPVGSEVTDPAVRGKIEGLWKVVNKEGVSVDDPTFNPMATGAPSLAGLGCQRVMVCVAEKDVLAERGRAYCEALKRSCWGGEVEMAEAEEEDHVFFYMKPECDKALDLLAKIDNFFKRTIDWNKLSSRANTTAQLSSRNIQNFGNQNTRIMLKLPRPKNHPSVIRPKVFMSYDLKGRENYGEIIHKVSNFHMVTISSKPNLLVMLSNCIGM